MIIDSMSIEEMQKEVKKDIDSLYTKIYYLFAENRRFFVKSKKFPIYKIFSWESRVTQIEWNIIILARKKKEQTIPKIIPYVRYQSYGTGIFYVRRMEEGVMTITFTPHCIRRYRERYLKDDKCKFSVDEVFCHLFRNTELPTYYYPPEENKFVMHIDQGIVLGEYVGDKTQLLAKTFVSKDMLFEKQMEEDNFSIDIKNLVMNSERYRNNSCLPLAVNKYTGDVDEIFYRDFNV